MKSWREHECFYSFYIGMQNAGEKQLKYEDSKGE